MCQRYWAYPYLLLSSTCCLLNVVVDFTVGNFCVLGVADPWHNKAETVPRDRNQSYPSRMLNADLLNYWMERFATFIWPDVWKELSCSLHCLLLLWNTTSLSRHCLFSSVSFTEPGQNLSTNHDRILSFRTVMSIILFQSGSHSRTVSSGSGSF